MNRALPEMILAGNCTDVSVLERQRSRLRYQQQQQQEDNNLVNNSQFLNTNNGNSDFEFFSSDHQCHFENFDFAVKPDPGLDSGWPELGQFGFGSGFEVGISRALSCPVEEKVLMMMTTCKKRKADNRNQSLKAPEEDHKDKKMNVSSEEGDSKITEQNSNSENKNNNNNKKKEKENSADNNSKVSDVQKQDYIHVRARRGQATDSHSLAERVRREKISERMKYLQDLVPGCNKITGKAGMLDEIINYVQSLQRQVEFLSMKLAAVNPTLDFNIDNFFTKEVFPACTPNIPIGLSSEMTNSAYLPFNNPLEQLVSCSGLEMGISTSDIALRRTISAPVSVPETLLDSSILNLIQSSSNWDANLQSLNNYGMEFLQGRSTSFPPHQFAGPGEPTNMKMEMM